ncbi:MAG: putative DNA modification/repair radical SAM protein [Chitinivibrionales bacterium]|nr:putative DNA modification/repair radical SAM protein [Chitinivibrionales bacterium]
MELLDKLEILGSGAKYDASCASSGATGQRPGTFGSVARSGICHSWAEDGRCISLLKVLMTNNCIYDCAYCINRRSNDITRTMFTPQEISYLTTQFYRKNYIEGLFLSSAIIKNPDYTMELMISALFLLRHEQGFRGYIHVKIIPGASTVLTHRAGLLADRVSVNIELPSRQSLALLAPQKNASSILTPMQNLSRTIVENRQEIASSPRVPPFAPAGQSTQLIIGATADSDLQIMVLSSWLYRQMRLKRVYYSAYVPVNNDRLLPALLTPPLQREHRLYQADWLLRFYGFTVDELFFNADKNLNSAIDPKMCWALANLHFFPIELNTAEYEMLIRIPGVGVRGGRKICQLRRVKTITADDVGKLGIAWKRARFFVTVNHRREVATPLDTSRILAAVAGPAVEAVQTSLFDTPGASLLSQPAVQAALPQPFQTSIPTPMPKVRTEPQPFSLNALQMIGECRDATVSV